jgi:hypothetical protein
MSAEIKQYPGVAAPDKPRTEQPVEQVIEVLEELLADAREGRIRAIAYAAVSPGEHTSFGWARGKGQTAHEMMAAICDLSYACAMERVESARDRDKGGAA